MITGVDWASLGLDVRWEVWAQFRADCNAFYNYYNYAMATASSAQAKTVKLKRFDEAQVLLFLSAITGKGLCNRKKFFLGFWTSKPTPPTHLYDLRL